MFNSGEFMASGVAPLSGLNVLGQTETHYHCNDVDALRLKIAELKQSWEKSGKYERMKNDVNLLDFFNVLARFYDECTIRDHTLELVIAQVRNENKLATEYTARLWNYKAHLIQQACIVVPA